FRFEDYMKLKNNPPPCYFIKKTIRRYEMWLKNISNRIRRIRQKQKVQSNVNTTPNKPHYIYNQQKNICMNNTFLTPFPKKPVQYQSYYSQRESWIDKPRSLIPPPLSPKPIALINGFKRYTMRRSTSAPEISAYRFERNQVLIDAEEYFNSV
ncbi:2905_t:CDS:1, partial [Funneliformis caledonium]